MRVFNIWTVCGLAAAVACAHAPTSTDDVDAATPPIPPASCDSIGASVTVAPLRRLTRVEYDNTVRDLLNDSSAPASSFVPDLAVNGFTNNARALTVTQLLASQFFSAAEQLSRAASTHLQTIVPCDYVNDETNCVAQFISDFGKKAYRRPLTADEKAAVTKFFTLGRAVSVADGFRLVLERLLVSPSFLYRTEVAETGQPDQILPLDGYEVASRLSYFLWQSMPDDTLFAEADAGRLDTSERIEAQARRMLADPRSRQTVLDFHAQWLGLHTIDNVDKSDPALNKAVRASMHAEADRLINTAFWSGDPKALFTSDTTFLDDTLEQFYDEPRSVTPEIAPPDFTKSAPDSARHSGILTLGAINATYSRPEQTAPVFRGKFVRERLLCEHIAPPPGNVVIVPPEPSFAKTARERWEAHWSDPACSGCHKMTDPIGFAFETFDELGRFRTTENNQPIDTHGEIIGSRDVDGVFVGVAQLGQKLAKSQEVQRCIATQWYRFAYGRAENDDDKCALGMLGDQFVAAPDPRELIIMIVKSEAFRERRVPVPLIADPNNPTFGGSP